MNVTMCSAFRNATPYLATYIQHVADLHSLLNQRGDTLRCVWGEGDSTDETRRLLNSTFTLWDVDMIDCTHGGKVFGSIEDAERFDQLAYVGNCIWQAIPKDADAVVYVESDLLWQPETIIGLLDALTVYPAVSPMVMDSHGGTFYDVWAFRRNGQRFTKQPPYHRDIDGTMLKLDSAGSCMAIRGHLARKLHFPADCFVGFCRELYRHDGELYLDPSLAVFHP